MSSTITKQRKKQMTVTHEPPRTTHNPASIAPKGTPASAIRHSEPQAAATTGGPQPGVPVQVRFTSAGTPLAVRHKGRIWAVSAEPMHWFTRESWWESRRTAPVGAGNLVDIEIWQVQVRANSKASLRTFELRRQPLSDQWLLEDITDNRSLPA